MPRVAKNALIGSDTRPGESQPTGQPTMNAIDISLVQRRRKQILRVSGLGLLALCLAIGPLWAENSVMQDAVETLGFACIAAGVLGRTWCSLYIGGRKTREVVDLGPYSISRNPLYVFTYVAMFGVGAQSGSRAGTGAGSGPRLPFGGRT